MRAILGGAAVLAVLLAASAARADEEKVALDKLPKAVTEAVKKRFPKAELVEAAKETDKDKTEYEVTLKDGGTKYDVMLTPEGAITLIEKTIAEKDLPKAVAATLADKYPKATFTTVEEMTVMKDGKEEIGYYEVLLTTADKKVLEVELFPDGKVKNTEEKTEEKEEKKDDKKGEKKKDEPKPK